MFSDLIVNKETAYFSVLSYRGDIEWGLHPLDVQLKLSEPAVSL
jgi:hypothetical protein